MYELLKELIGKNVSIDTDDDIHEGKLVAVEGNIAKIITDQSSKKVEKTTAYYVNLKHINYVEVVEFEKNTNF